MLLNLIVFFFSYQLIMVYIFINVDINIILCLYKRFIIFKTNFCLKRNY